MNKKLIILIKEEGFRLEAKLKNTVDFIELSEEPELNNFKLVYIDLDKYENDDIDELRLINGDGSVIKVSKEKYTVQGDDPPGHRNIYSFNKYWHYGIPKLPDDPDIKFQAIEMSDNGEEA